MKVEGKTASGVKKGAGELCVREKGFRVDFMREADQLGAISLGDGRKERDVLAIEEVQRRKHAKAQYEIKAQSNGKGGTGRSLPLTIYRLMKNRINNRFIEGRTPLNLRKRGSRQKLEMIKIIHDLQDCIMQPFERS